MDFNRRPLHIVCLTNLKLEFLTFTNFEFVLYSRSAANDFKVRVGSTTHSNSGDLIQVKKLVQHPQFNMDNIDYDFSLLKLETIIALSASKKPVSLPKQSEEVPDNTNCLVSGWGDTQVSRIITRFTFPIIKEINLNMKPLLILNYFKYY